MISMTSDGVPKVRRKTREILKYGATQIKITTGGGVSSIHDPIGVSQYSAGEIEAVVEEATNYNTYVLSHMMTDRGVRTAVGLGAKPIEHGFFASQKTLKRMRKSGVWLSAQPLQTGDLSFDDPVSAAKLETVMAGIDGLYEKAAKIGVKVAFGTDLLFDAEGTEVQGALLARLGKWYTPYEVLKIATSGNAELLEMSGPRHPYQEGLSA